MPRRLGPALAPAVLSFLPSMAAGAPPARLLDKETFFHMESVANPAISPDGSQVVFTRAHADMNRDQSQSNLWIVDAKGERLRQLTDGSWRDSAPEWSPDGRRIAFLSNRSGSTQVHVLWVDTREVSQITRVESEPRSPRWSPDGKHLAFTAIVPDETPALTVKLPATPKGATLAKGAVLVQGTTWARDGAGPTPPGHEHVFTVDALVGGTPRQVTSGDYDHSTPAWSADGRTLYLSGLRKPDAEHLRGDSEIYAVSLDLLEIRPLTDRNGPDSDPVVSPDGRWIAYTGFDQRNYTSHLRSLYVMDARGGGKRLWAGDLPSSPSNPVWAGDGSGVYYTMQERGEENLYFAGLKDAAPRRLTGGRHVLSQASVSRTGQVAAVRSGLQEPGVVVTFATARPAEVRVLVDVNRDVLQGVRLADAEELWWSAKDGVRAQGWLMRPPDAQPGRAYPLVLWIHGGPWSMYSVAWSWPFQNLAASGYAVLWTNPRGSTGYGQEFVNGIQFSYPGKDYDDLMAGVDAALAKGGVDEDNLFVCGGSGGGLLTAWIVGQTDRFRAAVSMRPVINWHSFVGTTDGTLWYHQFQKYPWEDPLEYAARSPLHHVAKVTTPTMVMTGEADLRTPIAQSEEFYRALKVLRKADTLLVRMPEEYHGWRRPSHQLLQQLYLLAWFDKYRGKPAGSGVTAAAP
jgi:dipeptidyl aminopeptidase/acylaminoacyl peptidase